MFAFRFLFYIAIGSLFISTINIFSDVNEYEKQQESRDAVERLMKPPSNVIQ
jgi:hypothetical protein